MRDRHVEIRPVMPVNPFQPQPEAPNYAHYIRTHGKIAAEVDEISYIRRLLLSIQTLP